MRAKYYKMATVATGGMETRAVGAPMNYRLEVA
jgi:hypothetical protein